MTTETTQQAIEITKDNLIEQWNNLRVEQVRVDFSCGGDQMNDMTATVVWADPPLTGEFGPYDDGQGWSTPEESLAQFIMQATYEVVEFYVNSDGHYQGESGTVTVTMDDGALDFDKQSEEETIEEGYLVLDFDPREALTEVPEEEREHRVKSAIDFLKANVEDFNAVWGAVDMVSTANYAADCMFPEHVLDDLNTIMNHNWEGFGEAITEHLEEIAGVTESMDDSIYDRAQMDAEEIEMTTYDRVYIKYISAGRKYNETSRLFSCPISDLQC